MGLYYQGGGNPKEVGNEMDIEFFVAEQKKYEEENGVELKRMAREHAKKIIMLYLGSAIKLANPNEDYKKSFIENWIRPEDGYRINLK
ncbi:MAG: hypothetical protein K6E57_05070 [Fibrobacter sp.]|nr:hypothetical protein [Fibrobacter sp.]